MGGVCGGDTTRSTRPRKVIVFAQRPKPGHASDASVKNAPVQRQTARHATGQHTL